MKEIDLDYGSFVTPADRVKNLTQEELNLKKNIDALNRHFEEASKNKSENDDAQSLSDSAADGTNENDTLAGESISIVASVEDDESVLIDEPPGEEPEEDSGSTKKTSIGVKLICIISTLVILSMGLITILVSYFVTADTRANAENSNFTLNVRTSSDIENRINSVISSVSLFCDLFDVQDKSDEELSFDAASFFDRNSDIAVIAFLSRDRYFSNTSFFAANGISSDIAGSYIASQTEAVNSAKNGIVQIENASPYFLTPVIAVFFSFNKNGRSEIVSAIFSTEKLQESVSTGKINETFLINNRGVVLIHPDIELMMQSADLSENKFVKSVIQHNASGIQQTYIDDDGEEFYAACQKITEGNCRVITQVKTSVILAAIRGITRRNLLLTVAILSIAVLIIWIFAKSLSIPLENLTAVTDEINRGNFNTDLFDKLNVKRRDEIGVLNKSTKNERDILNTVTSLTNKGVTKAIVRKEIDFEPHLKDITIFFSDIRGFTAISDGFNKRFGEKSAAEIIEFLNDYMSRMVNCISITGGVVDKFEGDAVMAAWGVLRDDNLDYEKLPDDDPKKPALKARHEEHIKADALSAIRSTIAMRYALMKYNKDAEKFTQEHEHDLLAKYKPYIRIGCGLNSGRATVGFMGSKEKMEFTSIGDAVNLASRTESSNKPCGTDILITEDTYNILKTDFIRCEENNFTLNEKNIKNEVIVECIPVTFEVKGKGAQHFYGVVNMPQFDAEEFFRTSDPNFVADKDCLKAVGKDGPMTLAEVRELLGIPVPDFEVVNLNEEENKVKAQ
ncbi:MAG: adenylate/guanylate cyclase domain-containing protein [Treponema sp.]